ncbi:unnamed protein product [Cylicocyclus nassatus]|uniref:Uncharacterized protein n=1 Tax=Cylicocyclus nassatus TaxID=53992 RepID=A0AA36H5C2_CYLNA|nr:unnamed protein product [Cylicocyclus nassatus]
MEDIGAQESCNVVVHLVTCDYGSGCDVVACLQYSVAPVALLRGFRLQCCGKFWFWQCYGGFDCEKLLSQCCGSFSCNVVDFRCDVE